MSDKGFGQRSLAAVERIGNRLPDPTLLFIALLLAVWVLSWLLSYVEWGAVDPRNGDYLDYELPVVLVSLLIGRGYGTGEYELYGRAVADFEYEYQMAGMNQQLNDQIETVFLMADVSLQPIASKLVKEIARYGGPIDKFVTPQVAKDVAAKL